MRISTPPSYSALFPPDRAGAEKNIANDIESFANDVLNLKKLWEAVLEDLIGFPDTAKPDLRDPFNVSILRPWRLSRVELDLALIAMRRNTWDS